MDIILDHPTPTVNKVGFAEVHLQTPFLPSIYYRTQVHLSIRSEPFAFAAARCLSDISCRRGGGYPAPVESVPQLVGSSDETT